VIITSRRQLASGVPLHLAKLTRPESVLMLRAFRPALAEADADALARLCGDLPVALRVAGGFLKRHAAKPLPEYLAELRADPLARLRDKDESLDINILFAYSVRGLTDAQRAAFARISVFTSPYDREAGTAVAECASDDLDELATLNLLEYDPASTRFDWHDLVREYALAQLRAVDASAPSALNPQPAEQSARLRHAAHYTKVGRRAKALYKTKGKVLEGLALFDRERRHLEAAFEFLRPLISQSGRAALPRLSQNFEHPPAELGLT